MDTSRRNFTQNHYGSVGLMVSACLAFAVQLPLKAAPTAHTASEVLLVINTNSSASQSIGSYYQNARGITNVVNIQCDDSATASDKESIFYADYLTQIANPISAYLATHPGINFIVLTKGIPLTVSDSIFGSGETMNDGAPSVDSSLAALNYTSVRGARKIALNKYSPHSIGYAYTNRYYNTALPFTHAKYGGYLVTRLDGYTTADAKALVDRALDAENGIGNGPFLLDVEPDFGLVGTGIQLVNPYSYNNAQMLAAANVLEASGVNVNNHVSESFAGHQSNLQGYYSLGSNDDNFDLSAYESLSFASGAIGDTIVSTSARTMIGSPGVWPAGEQSLIADLVTHGITGVEGYVSEPQIYSSIASIVLPHYVTGYTLAESFYAGNQVIAWEGVVLGDPLCAPYFSSPYPSVTPVRASGYRAAVRGTVKEACSEGLLDVPSLAAGSYLGYALAYSDAATSFIARVSSTNSSDTTINIVLDNPTKGAVVGTITVPPTGDSQTWTTVTCSLPGNITRLHHFYLVFSDTNTSIEWFAFLNSTQTSQLVQGARVALALTANGNYISIGATATHTGLAANSATASTAQQFQVVDAGNGHIALRSLANNLYLSADPKSVSPLTASSSTIGINQTFIKHNVGGAKIALQSLANGLYISVDTATNTLVYGNALSVTAEETFTVTKF